MYQEKIYRHPNSTEYEYSFAGNYGAKGEKRAPRQKRTPEDIERQNRYNKKKTVRRLIEDNFQKGDYWTTLTYKDGAGRPIEEIAKDTGNFLDRMRREYKKQGIPFKYIYRIEIGSRGGVHVHIIMNRIEGLDLLLQKKWSYGHVHNELLDDGTYEDLADYVVKDPTDQQKKLMTALGIDEKKIIRYSCSRNLLRKPPEVTECKRSTMRKIFNSDLVPAQGFYIDRDSIRRGVNAFTGMSYLYYREKRLTDKVKGRAEPVKICECPKCHQFTLDQIECNCERQIKRIRKKHG